MSSGLVAGAKRLRGSEEVKREVAAAPLDIRVIRGSGAELATLVRLVKKECVLLAQPPMTIKVYKALVAKKALAGPQIGKDRATLQSTSLDDFEGGSDDLATFVFKQRKWAAGDEGGSRVNDFWNFNGGRSAIAKAADPPVWKLRKPLKVNDADNGGWHADNPTEGKKDEPNTGRILSYHMTEGNFGGLHVRRGGAEIEIVVPRGAALYASNVVLRLEHKHGANGRCLSFVSEVSRPEVVVGATAAELEASSAAQPPLPLEKDFGVWEPWLWARGPKQKFGKGRGVGSPRRAATRFVLGPKAKGKRRKVKRKAAREIVRNMSPTEIKEACASIMSAMGASRSPPAAQYPRRPPRRFLIISPTPPTSMTLPRCPLSFRTGGENDHKKVAAKMRADGKNEAEIVIELQRRSASSASSGASTRSLSLRPRTPPPLCPRVASLKRAGGECGSATTMN